MAADVLEGMMALVRHKTTGKEGGTRDIRADRTRTVAMVALAAALLAAAYIGRVVGVMAVAWHKWRMRQRDPETRREGK